MTEIIIQKIKDQGAVSFHDFMEMALYHPADGYYSSQNEIIGNKGDFYTSCCFTPLFGEMIALQLEEMWQLLGKQEFTIVEYGAGTGILCRDIMNRLKENTELYDQLNYYIIEKSEAMREKEKDIVPGKVSWYNHIGEIPAFTGCILSNEVLDNFSIHQVVMQEDLMEVYVGYDNGFTEYLCPASAALKDYMKQLNVILPKGFRTEINLEAVNWVNEIAGVLKKGFVLTIDYGYPSAELYSGHRNTGTLLCYRRHTINDQPYHYIGQQDITSHVNFSALYHWGKKNGLECSGFTNQAYFLLGLGMADCAKQKNFNGQTHHLLRGLLLDMGPRLKVLVQHKGIHEPMLSGLRFCQRLI